jgi:hypothetical protein
MNVESIIQLIYADKLLTKLRKKIEAGQGTFKDTTDYCNRSAELLGRLFSENVLSMPDVERITANDTLLKDRYKDINDLLDKVQRTVDKKQGINIRPQHAPFNQERADQIGRALTDKTVSEETIQRRAGSAPATMTRAMQDDYVEENAKFRSDAGLKTYLVRVTDGDCCEWCTKVAGRYEYGTEPHDIYRRHDNCGCSVTYENGKQRQNVWTKKTWEVPAEDAGAPEPVRLTKEQTAGRGASEPVRFNKRQAEHLNNVNNSKFKRIINNSSIDNLNKESIMEVENYKPATSQEINDFKQSLHELGFEDVTGFENYTESNEHLLEIVEDFGKLKADYPDYFNGLKLDFGVTKGMTDDSYAGYVPDTSTIHLNPLYYNNFRLLRESYVNDIKNRYHPKRTTYRANIFHEFGHHLESVENLQPKNQIKSLFEKTFGRNYTRKQADKWIKNGLSLYAAEGHFEDFIAECFAEYYDSPSPRKISFDFIKSLEKKE